LYSITKASGGVTLRGLRASAHNALGIKKEILNTLINRIIQYIYGHKPIIKKAHRELCRARDEQRTVERQGEEAAHTNLPLWEVVEVCGFVSQSYLTKFYPMNFGASPGEIRRKL